MGERGVGECDLASAAAGTSLSAATSSFFEDEEVGNDSVAVFGSGDSASLVVFVDAEAGVEAVEVLDVGVFFFLVTEAFFFTEALAFAVSIPLTFFDIRGLIKMVVIKLIALVR